MSNYDQTKNPEEPYNDINYDSLILNLTLSNEVQESIRIKKKDFWSTQTRELRSEWLADTRRIRRIIGFEPYRSSITSSDILRLWQISTLSYANLIGINLTPNPVNLRTYLSWFLKARFGIEDVSEVDPYTKYTTKSDVVGVHMDLASILMLPRKDETAFSFLQPEDYELFKNNDVFLGIQTQGMFYLFSEIAGFITQSKFDEDMSEEELGTRIHNQMGFVSLSIVTDKEEVVTISDNVKESIQAIASAESDQSLVILIDETLPQEGEGDTFRSIIKGLVREFGIELVRKVKIYVADAMTFTFNKERSIGDFYVWQLDNTEVEREIKIRKDEIMV